MKINVTEFYSNQKVEDCPKTKCPEYAFIGRSNVGKSSLINTILQHNIARTSSKPGKTQLINHIIINQEWAVVDLPGYGYAKASKTTRQQMLEMTKKYFTKRGITLCGVFMLIDIRVPPQKLDLDWMEWLVKNNIYFIRVFTKCDGINRSKTQSYIKKYDQIMKTNNWGKIPETIITSSSKKLGRKEILDTILKLNKLFQNIG
tara:strand:+ start:1031 stop:1639 length:609 start_codon:yes stop_codon:yes gene_type:complete